MNMIYEHSSTSVKVGGDTEEKSCRWNRQGHCCHTNIVFYIISSTFSLLAEADLLNNTGLNYQFSRAENVKTS